MKKTYRQPLMEVADIKIEHALLAGSGKATFSDESAPLDINGGDAKGEGLSRRGGLWDDED
mgnify:CR=1 FL=1